MISTEAVPRSCRLKRPPKEPDRVYPLVKNQEYACDGVDAPRRLCAKLIIAESEGVVMEQVHTVGLDTAKHAFQVHGAAVSGEVVLQKKLRRHQVLAFFSTLPRCRVAMEAALAAILGPRNSAAWA